MAKPTGPARMKILNRRIRRLKHTIYRHEQERKGYLSKAAKAYWAAIALMSQGGAQ